MRLTVIGSGTGAPSATRVSPAHLVAAGSQRVLIDCGSGAVHRMSALGVAWAQITHVLVTHFHADHISDIPTLLYAWRYGTLQPRTAPVSIIGPPGTVELVRRMDEMYGSSMLNLGFETAVADAGGGTSLNLGDGVVVDVFSTVHTDESVAYSVSRRGARIVVTGDTPIDPRLAEWAGGCDLLLTECSLPRELAVPSHMTPEECAEFAALAHPGALALAHFYEPVQLDSVRSIIAERYKGPVYLARDGWEIDIKENE